MKRLLLTLTCVLAVTVLLSQPGQYYKVKVLATVPQLVELAEAGLNITEGTLKMGQYLISDYSEKELLIIQESGLEYEILIEDVSKYYVDRNEGLSTNPDDYKGMSEWEVPEHFDFGSMSGHCTYDEIVAHLDNMATLFPSLITTKETIGQSIEDRDLWMVKISDNPNVNESEPEVLYTSLHHAREPAGAMTLLFYMYYLLENYDTDPFIQTLVDNSELYFLPVVNPDGYVFNETNSPTGGGEWRKNRRDNGVPGCMGVDPNRNYGYMWGLDDIGSSPDPCHWSYRGDSAFSEPEIAAVRDFCEDHEFKFALNYHTYGNLLLYPWGYTNDPSPDDELFFTFSTLMTVDNLYDYGLGGDLLYPSNGDADDWMYGEQTTKEKIFSFTPELGSSNDGFWCMIDRIIPIAQENMIQNIRVALFSGSYANAEAYPPVLVNNEQGYIKFDLTKLGLQDGATYSVSLNPISGWITSVGDEKEYSGLEILEPITDSISYTLLDGIPSGTAFDFEITVNYDAFSFTDTVTRVFGFAETLFEDDCNTFDYWISPWWDITSNSYYSPPASITDSPDGNYTNNQMSAAIHLEEFDLSTCAWAGLNFMAKWEIEDNFDYAQLQITSDGYSWDPVPGNYSVLGGPYQDQGEPVYDGFQSDWVLEEIDLLDYIGDTVSFRFVFKANDSIIEDGFYFDDFTLQKVDVATSVDDMYGSIYHGIRLTAIPNPADQGTITFSIYNPGKYPGLELRCFNIFGQLIFQDGVKATQERLQVDVQGWEPGLYLGLIYSENEATGKIKFLIR